VILLAVAHCCYIVQGGRVTAVTKIPVYNIVHHSTSQRWLIWTFSKFYKWQVAHRNNHSPCWTWLVK